MYISYKWLQNYLPDLHQYTPEQIANALTSSIAEVEQTTAIRQELENLYIGEIIQVEKHPKLTKLNVCRVNINDNDTRTIICGADNVRAKLKVVVCLPGGQVYNAKEGGVVKISEREMQGITSQGMICSAKELGLTEDHAGILELESDAIVGSDITHQFKDTIYEIENKGISHRSDCFSHEGIARELSAILRTSFIRQVSEQITLNPTVEPVEFSVEQKLKPELSKRFSAIVLKDIIVKPSPLWLQCRLSAVGVRPINNIVDTTNYIMLDKGQPMHAYDYDKLHDKKLICRKAKADEKAITLDGKTHKLSAEDMVITDGTSIEDIAGIMGGKHSEIGEKTTTVVLEAANFDMYTIRRSSRSLGIRTEASTRFEKGLDPNLTLGALTDAVKIILDLTNAEIASNLIDIYPEPVETKTVNLDTMMVSRFLGIDLTKQQISDILKSLTLEIIDEDQDETNTNKVSQPKLLVKIPTLRRDLNIEQDLLEEIARIYGYANIKPQLPSKDLTPVLINPQSKIFRLVTNLLTSAGMDEVMTYSFVNEELYNKSLLNIKDCVQITNPLSPELSHMRTSLLPSLLEKVKQNSKTFNSFKIFELGRSVRKALDNDGIHHQPRVVAGVCYDESQSELFFEAKGIVNHLLSRLNIKATYEAEISKDNSMISANSFHTARRAQIIVNSKPIGIVGELAPEASLNWKFAGRIGMFEIDLEALLQNFSENTSYQTISPYQAVKRDLSFWIKQTVTYQQIYDEIHGLKEQLIKNIDLVDIYTKPDHPEQKSLTLSLTLQSNDKTLTDQEIQAIIDQIVTLLNKNLKAEIRK